MEIYDFDNYKGKKVLITGHTGFKGTWLSVFLKTLGAEVIGYSTCSKDAVRLSDRCGILNEIQHIKGDVRDYKQMYEVFLNYQPEIIFHMAAQPIVTESYKDPVATYTTNVIGTLNLMECVRNIGSVKSVINITTDKVYKNQEWEWGYREDDELDGFEPYSNSKSCSELVTRCYIRSFFEHGDCAISTMRAGNVIGGGDVSVNRIIPDCVRAANKKEKILVRNPGSVRPYQHVLEPIYAYAMVAIAQYVNRDFFGFYNVGPYEEDHIKTEDLVKCFAEKWHEGVLYEIGEYKGPHEANLLKLDCSRIRGRFGWSPEWRIEKAIEKTVELEKVIARGGNVRKCMESQIREYLNDKNFVY